MQLIRYGLRDLHDLAPNSYKRGSWDIIFQASNGHYYFDKTIYPSPFEAVAHLEELDREGLIRPSSFELTMTLDRLPEMFELGDNRLARWLVVDGTAEDDTLQGDGEFAPFYVFDANAQRYVTGPLPTRNAAEKVRALILRAGA